MPVDPSIILAGAQQTAHYDSPLETMQKVLAARQLQQQSQAGLLQLQQQKQAIADDQSARSAYSANQGNTLATIAALAGKGLYKQAGSLQKQYGEQQKTQAETEKTVVEGQKARAGIAEISQKIQIANAEHTASLMGHVLDAPEADRPQAYQDALQVALQNHFVQPGQFPDQYTPELAGRLEAAQKTTISAVDQAKQKLEQQKMGLSEKHANAAEQLAALAQKQKQDYQQQQIALQQRGQDITMRGQNMTDARQRQTLEAQDTTGEISAQALDNAAETYKNTGQLPQLGQGKRSGALKAAILNKAAEKYGSFDASTSKANFEADKGSLITLQKAKDQVESFENTANKNLDVFLEKSKGVADLGSPILNAPARMISKTLLGSQKYAEFENARQTAVTEIAKVLSNPGVSGQLTDSARKEMENAISPNATTGQIQGAVNVLKRDMQNRKSSMDEQIGLIKGRLGHKDAEGSGVPPIGSTFNGGKVLKVTRVD